MRPIEKYVEAMENKDFAGLAELFTPDGILCDYCTTSASPKGISYLRKRGHQYVLP